MAVSQQKGMEAKKNWGVFHARFFRAIQHHKQQWPTLRLGSSSSQQCPLTQEDASSAETLEWFVTGGHEWSKPQDRYCHTCKLCLPFHTLQNPKPRLPNFLLPTQPSLSLHYSPFKMGNKSNQVIYSWRSYLKKHNCIHKIHIRCFERTHLSDSLVKSTLF